MAEILYERPEFIQCLACSRRWRPEGPDDEERCRRCGSEDVEEAFREIPSFDDDPGVGLVVAVETQIPRTQEGTILHREMVAWLRFHGVRDRWEMLQWESWFIDIHAMRSRLVEEMMDVGHKPTENNEQED